MFFERKLRKNRKLPQFFIPLIYSILLICANLRNLCYLRSFSDFQDVLSVLGRYADIH
jgi:hypothetical protein